MSRAAIYIYRSPISEKSRLLSINSLRLNSPSWFWHFCLIRKAIASASSISSSLAPNFLGEAYPVFEA